MRRTYSQRESNLPNGYNLESENLTYEIIHQKFATKINTEVELLKKTDKSLVNSTLYGIEFQIQISKIENLDNKVSEQKKHYKVDIFYNFEILSLEVALDKLTFAVFCEHTPKGFNY